MKITYKPIDFKEVETQISSFSDILTHMKEEIDECIDEIKALKPKVTSNNTDIRSNYKADHGRRSLAKLADELYDVVGLGALWTLGLNAVQDHDLEYFFNKTPIAKLTEQPITGAALLYALTLTLPPITKKWLLAAFELVHPEHLLFIDKKFAAAHFAKININYPCGVLARLSFDEYVEHMTRTSQDFRSMLLNDGDIYHFEMR